MIQLGIYDLAVGGDRRERSDEAVHDPCARADHRRTPYTASSRPRAGLDDDVPLDAGRIRRLCLRCAVQGLEHEPVFRAVGPSCRCRSTSRAAPRDARGGPDRAAIEFASVISSRPAGWCDRVHGLVDVRVEDVDAHEREIGRRIRWLFDQPEHLAQVVDRGNPELTRVVDVREQDLRDREVAGRTLGLLELLDELRDALLEHVVAEVHHEVVVAEEVAGDEHAVRQAEGASCGM